MPEWLLKLLPSRAWAQLTLPVGLTILSVLLSGVTVSCEGQSQHMSFGEFSAGRPLTYATAFLLPYGVDFVSNQGQAIEVKSNQFIGLGAMLIGFLLVVRRARRANEGFWLILPYWLLSFLAVLVFAWQQHARITWSPLIFYLLGAPLACAMVARIAAWRLQEAGYLDLDPESDEYRTAVREFSSGLASATGRLAVSTKDNIQTLTQPPKAAGSPPAGPGQPATTPPPPIWTSEVEAQSLGQVTQKQAIGASQPQVGSRPAAAQAPVRLDQSVGPPPAAPVPAAPIPPPPAQISLEPVHAVAQSPVETLVEFAAVCPFCGNRKIRQNKPGMCAVCGRNLAVLKEKPTDPRCTDCDGRLLAGARFCHHCGLYLG